MARKQPTEIKVDTFPDHQVITQPNPLRKLVRLTDEEYIDEAVARPSRPLPVCPASSRLDARGMRTAERGLCRDPA